MNDVAIVNKFNGAQEVVYKHNRLFSIEFELRLSKNVMQSMTVVLKYQVDTLNSFGIVYIGFRWEVNV
jgi:hypothetical protein